MSSVRDNIDRLKGMTREEEEEALRNAFPSPVEVAQMRDYFKGAAEELSTLEDKVVQFTMPARDIIVLEFFCTIFDGYTTDGYPSKELVAQCHETFDVTIQGMLAEVSKLLREGNDVTSVAAVLTFNEEACRAMTTILTSILEKETNYEVGDSPSAEV